MFPRKYPPQGATSHPNKISNLDQMAEAILRQELDSQLQHSPQKANKKG